MNKTILVHELTKIIGLLSVQGITENDFLERLELIETTILMYRDSIAEDSDRIEPEPKKND